MYKIEDEYVNEELMFTLIQDFETKHRDSVSSLIQLNETMLASSSRDKSIIIWCQNLNQTNYNPFKCINILVKHTGPIEQLLKFDELSFASCSSDKTIIVWVKKRERSHTFEPKKILAKHTSFVNTIIYNRETRELISGSADESISIWLMLNQQQTPKSEVRMAEEPLQILKTDSYVFKLCLISKCMFASGHESGSVKIWHKKHGHLNYKLYLMLDQTKSIFDLIYLKIFKYLLVASNEENRIGVVNFKELIDEEYKGEMRLKIKECLEHEQVFCLVELSNGVFVSGGLDKNVKVWQPSGVFLTGIRQWV
jgi:WD40 repeat protein